MSITKCNVSHLRIGLLSNRLGSRHCFPDTLDLLVDQPSVGGLLLENLTQTYRTALQKTEEKVLEYVDCAS